MECITHCHCMSHLTTSLPPHFISRHSTSNAISDIFQTTPHSMSHHHSSPYHTFRITQHLSQHTIPLCNTIFQNRTISHCTRHFTLLTYHITPHSMYSTPQNIYWPHLSASHHHIASHHTFTQHCTAFHMFHILHHSTTSDCDHT